MTPKMTMLPALVLLMPCVVGAWELNSFASSYDFEGSYDFADSYDYGHSTIQVRELRSLSSGGRSHRTCAAEVAAHRSGLRSIRHVSTA